MHLLITAYACRPGAGSEEGLGWGIPLGLASRGHDVTLLTRPRYRRDIEGQMRRAPESRLTVAYVEERAWTFRLGWTVGSALRYELWLWDAATRALAIDRVQPFDAVHHLSYGSLLGGSFLWRLRTPFVFGPIGGGQAAPDAFLGYFGGGRRVEKVRNLLVRWGWPALLPARCSVRAAIVLVTNADTQDLARRMGGRRIERMLDVGLPDDFFPQDDIERPAHDGPLRLLWVGRMMPRKGLRLTIEALQSVPREIPVELHILGDPVGGGDVRPWARAHPGPHSVVFHGAVPHDDVRDAYRRADAFIFTSLRESCGVQLLEAMAWSLPIVTLDLHGASWLVPDEGARKVPVSDPASTRQGVADAIVELASDSALRGRLGAVNGRAARQYRWPAKVEALEAVFERLVERGRMQP